MGGAIDRCNKLNKHCFWLGVCLIIRLVLFTLPELIYYSLIRTICVLLVFLYLQLVYKPFKSPMMNYVDNFLIGTIMYIMIGALFTDSGDHLAIEHFTGLIEILEKVLVVLIVLIGYATVTGIFVYLPRERFKKTKSMFLSRIKSIGQLKSKTNTVTHSSASIDIDNEQSMIQSSDLVWT